MNPEIRLFTKEDWSAVSEIYHLGILTGDATFETIVPEYETWIKKFHSHLLWVTTINSKVVGWAGLQPVSTREVYAGATEITIYVHPSHGGKGLGRALMEHVIRESENANIWTIYAAIFPENRASISLHEAIGFREIGYREKIGKLNGRWRDTTLYERRSKIVGV